MQQLVWTDENVMGPFYLSESERVEKKYDVDTGQFNIKNKTKEML